MKLAIVGDPARKEKEEILIKIGKEVFDSVTYIPIDSIRLDIANGKIEAFSEDLDLYEMDCVLPLISPRYFNVFLSLVGALQGHTYLPFTFRTLFDVRGAGGLVKLSERGCRVAPFTRSMNDAMLHKLSEKIKYPCTLQIGEKRLKVKNKGVFNHTLHLKKEGQILTFWEGAEEPVDCLILEEQVFSPFGKEELIKRAGEVESIPKTIGSDFVTLSLTKNGITSISLSLDPSALEAVYPGVCKKLLEHFVQNIEKRTNPFDHFVELLQKV